MGMVGKKRQTERKTKETGMKNREGEQASRRGECKGGGSLEDIIKWKRTEAMRKEERTRSK